MTIDFSVDHGIAHIVLNRPERANALDTSSMKAMVDAFQEVRDNPAIVVAIITGAGDSVFCAGMDWEVLNEDDMPDRRYHDVPDGLMLDMKPYMKGIDIWKPVIAAVNGPAIALGAHLVIGADIRIAAANASIAFNETRMGDLADGGALARLPRQIPFVHAMDLLLTGRTVDAATMHQMGLVNEVVPQGTAMDRAQEIAVALVENTDSRSVQITKRAVITGLNVGLDQAFLLEALYKEMLKTGPNHGEGRLRSWADKYTGDR